MMRTKTTLLLGPAGSGKTARALECYSRAIAVKAPAQTVWLAPSSRAARQILSGLLAQSKSGAVLNPGVHTFATLAERIAHAARVPVKRIGPLQKRAVVRRLLDDLLEEGKLRHFSAIADCRGLVDLVGQFIAEWKRLEIWPEELRAAAARRGLTRKDEELVTLYERYQALLYQQDWYDAEGLIWLARARLRDGQQAPFPDVRLFVADGFSDFTRTEHEILELLADRSDEMIVTLPDEPGQERADLFAKSRRTAAQIQRRHPECTTVPLERRPIGAWPALEHLERRLFGHPRRTTDAPDAVGLEILAAGRELGEVEWLAARIKDLLAHGDPARGRVRPGQIVVVYRSLETAAPLVREVFARFGIPYYLESPRILSGVPVIGALLQLASLHAEDWPYRLLLAVWNQAYLQPGWPEWNASAAAELERLVRRAQTPRGRGAILAACEALTAALSAEDREEADELAARRTVLIAAMGLLKRFAHVLERLPKTATADAWLAALQTTAQDLGYWRHLSVEDQAGLKALADASASLKQLQDAMEDRQELDAAEFVTWLRELTNNTPLAQEHDEVGRVRVLTAASVRAIEAPYLFVAGLSERSFPAADGDQRAYSETERRALADAGLPLLSRQERAQEEMLLFYETITRATRRLCLSYPAMDDRAQPLSPSPYVTEVARAMGATAIPRQEVVDLSPLPSHATPWNAREWRLLAVKESAQGNSKLLAGLLSDPDEASRARNLLNGLRVVRERATGEGFGPFEGFFTGALAQRACAERMGPDRVWSATDLELYGKCPFRFLLSSELGLTALDEIELGMDHRGRGARMHQALATLHRSINLDHAVGTSPQSLDAAIYEELVRRVMADLERGRAEDGSLRGALLEIEQRELAEWLAAYAAQHAEYSASTGAATMQPLYFEAAFGMRRKRRDDEPARDELSVDECLELRRDDDVVRIAGRIDRIDVAEVAGTTVFNVLDYKTGKPPAKNEIASGVALQLPLYALAVERLLLRDREALPWQFGYWSVQKDGFTAGAQLHAPQGDVVAPTESGRDLLDLIERNVFAMVGAMRRGEFPMYSKNQKCAATCDFRRVCRVNQTRALEKRWEANPPPPA